MAEQGKKNRIKHSAFLRALSRFSENASKRAKNSLIARLLCGYFALDDKLKSSAAARIVSDRGPVTSALSSLRDGICRVFSTSPVKNRFTKFLADLLYIRTRDIGIYMFSAGLYAVIEYLIIRYAVANTELDISVLYGGAAVMAVSLFFFSGRSLVNTFIKNKVLSFAVYDLIGADRNRLVSGEVRIKNASIALLLGMLTGALAFFVPPYRVVLYILYAAVICAVFFTPESGAVLMITFLPFLPLKTLLTLCAVTTVSYLFKVLRKKRELRFGTLDIFVMLLAALTLFGKMITAKTDSSGTDSLYLLGIAGYFVCRNLLCKRQWLDRALHAAALSAAVVSWFGLLFYFCGTPEQMIAARSLYVGVGGEMTVFFGSSLPLAGYTVITAPLILYFALEKKRGRILYLLSFFASLAVLVLTFKVYAVITFVFVSVIVLAVYSKRTFIFAAFAVPLAVLTAVFMPHSWQLAVYEKIYTENALISNVWSGVMKMISSSPFGGFGIGSFNSVYHGYALPGYGAQNGAKSIYLQLFAEGGVMLMLVFAACLLLFFMFCFSAASGSDKKADLRSIYAPLTAVLAASAFGLTENLLSSELICLLMFSVMGCGAAAAEISRSESEYERAVQNWQEV